MANQLINFEQGSSTTGDSGEREADAAIKPVVAGERAASTVIDRPLENLRERTEFLRSAVEELMFRADSDHWIITGGNDLGMIVGGATAFPTVTWDAVGGTFTVSEDIVVQPLLAPEVDKYAEKIYSFTDGVPATATFTFSTAQFDHQNANALRIIWEAKPAAEISGGTCATTLEGTPEHILRIVIRNDGATRASDVHSALGTLFLAPSPFTYVGMGGTATTFLLAVPADYDYLLVGTYSRELHHIPAAEFVNYFGPPALNALIPDGDTLGIYYPFLVDPNPLTFGGRRQATTDTGAAPNTGVTAAQLFQTSIEPEKIPYAIPLCRRIGTHLVFVDGTVVAHGQTATFGGEGSIDALQAAYAAHVGGSADKHPAADITTALIAGSPESAAASDVQTQLEALYGHVNDRVEIAALADNLGGDSGDTLVGCDAVAGTPTALAQGTVKTQTSTLLTGVNARTVRAATERVSSPWLFRQKLGGCFNSSSFPEDAIAGGYYWGESNGSFGYPACTYNRISTGLVPLVGSAAIAWLDSDGFTYNRLMCLITAEGGSSGGTIGGKAYRENVNTGLGAPIGDTDLGGLPATGGVTWAIRAVCSSGKYLYGLFWNGTTGYCLQKYDMSEAVATPMWSPATTVAYDCAINFNVFPDRLAGAGPGLRVGPVARICVASSTRIAVLVGNESTTVGAVAIYTSATGALVGIGRGSAPSGASIYPMGGMVSDGTVVWFTYRTVAAQTITTSISIGCVSISSPTSTAGTPIVLSTGTNSYGCVAMAFDGERVWAHDGEESLQIYERSGSNALVLADTISTASVQGTALSISDLIYTGMRIYGLALIGDFKPKVFSVDVAETLIATPKLLTICKESEINFGGGLIVAPYEMGRLVFDLDAIWAECGLDCSATCANKVRAIRNASFR